VAPGGIDDERARDGEGGDDEEEGGPGCPPCGLCSGAGRRRAPRVQSFFPELAGDPDFSLLSFTFLSFESFSPLVLEEVSLVAGSLGPFLL
jgi:hypothetical protein